MPLSTDPLETDAESDWEVASIVPVAPLVSDTDSSFGAAIRTVAGESDV